MGRLEGGYAFVTSSDGEIIKRKNQVRPGDELYVDITDGTIEAVVKEVRERK